MPNTQPKRVAILIESTRAYGRGILQGIANWQRENESWLVHVEPRALYDLVPEWLKTWDGDGIIARIPDKEQAQILKQTGIPVVNLKSGVESQLGPVCIETDREKVGEIAAEHLLTRGFRNFAFIGIPNSLWSKRECAGFQQRVQEQGYACEKYNWLSEDILNYQDGSFSEEIDNIATWLSGLPKPLGVLAADDYLGIQVLAACQAAVLHVPDTVAVLGVDNEEEVCQLAYPTLSSVMPNNVKIGREAAAKLQRRMKGEPLSDETLRIPPIDVATRHSTDVTATNVPVVASAMAFIRKNCHRGINVVDVIEHVKISRSVLQRHFRKELNQSIYEVILSQRLQLVKDLLRESELSLQEITVRTGFKHLQHLNNIFKEKIGYPLNKYRQENHKS